MNFLWSILVPTFLLLIVGIIAYAALSLKFFSKKIRDLDEVHVEFKEVQMEEFTAIVSAEADQLILREYRLTRRLRREASIQRIKVVRNRLRRMTVNGALCLEVARFYIRKIEEETGQRLLERDNLPCRLFDRGAMCQFMAGVCLARMHLLELMVIARPFYVPRLDGRFEVRGHRLMAWYEHMVEDILEVADAHEKTYLYENVLFMLTGVIEMPEPGEA